MSSPFRDDAPALEERLRRAEAALLQLEQEEAPVNALRSRRRRWNLQSIALGLVALLVGAAVGGAAVARRERAEVHASAQRYQAKQQDVEARRCAVELDQTKVRLHDCLGVTEHALEDRVELHVHGEPVGSPVRSVVARLDVAVCSPPPFRAETTFTPDGVASVVRIESLGHTKLTTEETLCLDRTFRAARVPSWSGSPMLVVADFKKPR